MRYRADPDSPFRLYDCLVPQLKEHVKVPDALLPKGYSKDWAMIRSLKKLRNEKKREEIVAALAQN